MDRDPEVAALLPAYRVTRAVSSASTIDHIDIAAAARERVVRFY